MAYSAESMSRAGQRSGFSASNAVRRGSPSGRVLPGRSAPSQLELVPQRRLAGKPRAEAAAEALRFVKSSGAAPEQRVQRFESSQARLVQRKSFAGEERAEPAGACPAAAFSSGSHALGAGETRAAGAANSTLRRIGGGQRPSGGFSASKSVRRGSSSGRASPGKNVPSQPELIPR